MGQANTVSAAKRGGVQRATHKGKEKSNPSVLVETFHLCHARRYKAISRSSVLSYEFVLFFFSQERPNAVQMEGGRRRQIKISMVSCVCHKCVMFIVTIHFSITLINTAVLNRFLLLLVLSSSS